ncbi:MAG: thioredoxin-dependent thiol peroxidase [Verrucomicrobia bacterium]|nr:thioredoxin-dependent thiol peroxidase [Verrucomicrobiota bacterium]MCH8525797.1 thioredoxin-dependent thiol peroxidase [Kiritimatiellia bacterium]
MSISEGKQAPDFSLPDASGVAHRLSDFRGKYVVVYFYPKDDTPGCTKEACGFRDLHEDFAGQNAVVLGISPDGSGDHEAFIEKYGLPFTLLCDEDKSVMKTYGAWGEKNMYGKISMGVIRSTVLVNPEGVVVKHWKKVAGADKHPAKVLEALAAAG